MENSEKLKDKNSAGSALKFGQSHPWLNVFLQVFV